MIKGTRLSVEFILSLFAEGWSREQLSSNYPEVSDAVLRAMFAYAVEAMHDQTLLPLRPGAL